MKAVIFEVFFLGIILLTLNAADFEFVVIGDTRPRFESETFRPFENLITKINSTPPAFVVNLGDLIYGYGPLSKTKQWDKYEAVARTITVPYYQIPGNHDTHSKQARKIYGRRFGRFYQSFDYNDCHFVLLDNTEDERWGYISRNQLDWLKQDLQDNKTSSVFVFLHFPVWEPERITPQFYSFWAETLHPLFKQSRVRAVFGGHYHTYGPTREFDGIRYFITGGGGAELRPEYRRSGGQYHFMKVKVAGDQFDVRVVTQSSEMTDPEADLMGGLQFASHNVSRIGIVHSERELKAGVNFSVSVRNPYPDALAGEAAWQFDASAFTVEPRRISLQIPIGATRRYAFTLKALQSTSTLQSLPQLEFNVVASGKRHRFHREVRFLQSTPTPYRSGAPLIDGDLSDWRGVPVVRLGGGLKAELRTCYDARHVYLAVRTPTVDQTELQELGFSDEVQIGMAHRLSETDFGGDFLRVGLNARSADVLDRTPGRKLGVLVKGAKNIARTRENYTTYEMALPLEMLRPVKSGLGTSLILNLSLPLPETEALTENFGINADAGEPSINSFSYRVRYGSDSLVPLFFVELTLEPKR